MIKKRFTVDDSGYVVIDNNSEKAFMFDTIEDCFACCDVLNEQHKEIRELREWIEDITIRYQEQRGIDLENDLE